MLDIAGIGRWILWMSDNSEHIRSGDERFEGWETVAVLHHQYHDGADTFSGYFWVGHLGG